MFLCLSSRSTKLTITFLNRNCFPLLSPSIHVCLPHTYNTSYLFPAIFFIEERLFHVILYSAEKHVSSGHPTCFTALLSRFDVFSLVGSCILEKLTQTFPISICASLAFYSLDKPCVENEKTRNFFSRK